jgi:hypothetical protein
MKKLILLVILFFGFIVLNAQSVEKSMKFEDFGTWDKTISPVNKISISSYVVKRVLIYTEQNKINDSPKYRYELIVVSNSIYNNKPTKTWIYGTRVFIDDKEATLSQSPDGFTAIINTEPTVIFRYESSLDTINIKITWESSQYFRGR